MTNEARLRPLTLEGQLQGHTHPLTQVGRALAEVTVQWIPARSPQAKGRIERLLGTFQDRLVSELRLAHARTLDEANAVLQTFLPRYNTRFTRRPAQPGSACRPLPADVALDDICCWAYERTVANDNTVTLGQQRFQLLPGTQRTTYAKMRVTLRHHLDGTCLSPRVGNVSRSKYSPWPILTPHASVKSPACTDPQPASCFILETWSSSPRGGLTFPETCSASYAALG